VLASGVSPSTFSILAQPLLLSRGIQHHFCICRRDHFRGCPTTGQVVSIGLHGTGVGSQRFQLPHKSDPQLPRRICHPERVMQTRHYAEPYIK